MWTDKSSTVVGVATGTPDGGVAVIRVSGEEAKSLARVVVADLGPPRVVTLRKLRGSNGQVFDEGLVVWMDGPNTFTGEDVVEFHVHSGALNVQQIVARLMELGALAAGPGEFSRRAVANGRMTIDEAEGVAALIASKTEQELTAARRLMAGELGKEVERIRGILERLRIEVEAHLDFPDDVETSAVLRWEKDILAICRELRAWLAGFDNGENRRKKKRVVIVGPPNVGKSALFNRLLQEDRALISGKAGTTRDYVECELVLNGTMLQLVDTAGLRSNSDDEIEVAGIERSLEQMKRADVIVWVEGADREDDGLSSMKVEVDEERTIYVENKRDVGILRDSWLGVAASTGEGILALRSRIEDVFKILGREEVPRWIGLDRHRRCAEGALDAVERSGRELETRSLELVAFGLGQADLRLGEMIGRSGLGAVGEDVLHGIFSTFCIGK